MASSKTSLPLPMALWVIGGPEQEHSPSQWSLEAASSSHTLWLYPGGAHLHSSVFCFNCLTEFGLLSTFSLCLLFSIHTHHIFPVSFIVTLFPSLISLSLPPSLPPSPPLFPSSLCLRQEQNDVRQFFLSLEKDPQQEEFLQGRMQGNPYSSTTAGLGPLMRDVKNKICTGRGEGDRGREGEGGGGREWERQ